MVINPLHGLAIDINMVINPLHGLAININMVINPLHGLAINIMLLMALYNVWNSGILAVIYPKAMRYMYYSIIVNMLNSITTVSANLKILLFFTMNINRVCKQYT